MGFYHSGGMRGALAAFAVMCLPMAANAGDALVDGARQCTQQFPVHERSQGIPMHLLAAISSTESGRWHDKLGMALPWPWTANVEGKGYYFSSKAEAIAKTQGFINAGYKSIDVGCMQVNLKHHPKAFRNLEEAFDPSTNVAYAAKFLRTNYNDLGDWVKATAAYHSRTPYYGKQYLARIEKNWNRIVNKVNKARGTTGGAEFNTASYEAPATVPSTTRKMNVIESTRGVKIIQVSNEARPSDVMVVRQTPTSTQPMRVADARSSMQVGEMIVKGSTDTPRMAVDTPAASVNSSGPKFVFAN